MQRFSSLAKSRSSQNLPGEKTKVSRPLFFHILAEGGDVIDGRIVDIMLELAEV